MEVLVGFTLGLVVALLGASVGILILLKKVEKRLHCSLVELKNCIESSFQSAQQQHEKQHQALLARLEQLKAELTQEMNQQTEHLDAERVKVLNQLKQELSFAIDRLENFLREPLI